MTVVTSVTSLNAKNSTCLISTTGRPKAAPKAVVPDFLILGAAKCATTSLHAWLSQHPQLLMSSPKEPVYFELEYEWGPEFYRSNYFAEWDGQRLLGDARTANLFLPFVPARVKESNPDAKLIILVRNPIERCLAHWWMEFRRLKEPLHFEEAVKANLERLRSGVRYETADEFRRAASPILLPGYAARRHSPAYRKSDRKTAVPRAGDGTYVEAGYYAEQIERYRSLFSDKQIRIFLLEDLQSRPAEVLCDVCHLLGISTEPVKDIECRSENVGKPMKRSLAMRYWLWRRLRGQALAYTEIRRRPAIRPEFRRFLADHFRPFNAELSKLLNRDLSHWS